MGAFVLQHSRAQAARRGARRRRRLRLEDLPLRRGSDRHLGGRQARPAGQVDGGAQRVLHVRRPWPRPRHPCRAGARQGRQVPRPAGRARRPPWAPICPPSRRAFRPTSTPRCWPGVYATPAIYAEVQGGVHQHRAGRRLSRRRAAGGDLSARAPRRQGGARAEDGSRRDPPQELHPADAFPYQTPVALQYDSGDYQSTLDDGAEGLRLCRLREAADRRQGDAASCAASASRPISRPAASRRRRWPARSAPARASTNRRRCACTRPAR